MNCALMMILFQMLRFILARSSKNLNQLGRQNLSKSKSLQDCALATAIWVNINSNSFGQSLILHKMLTFTGTVSLIRLGENRDVVLTNEFHRV